MAFRWFGPLGPSDEQEALGRPAVISGTSRFVSMPMCLYTGPVRENLRGVVSRGQGLMRDRMEKDPVWSEELGVNLHRGSINVCVSGDHNLLDQDIDPCSVRKIGRFRALQCVVRRGDASRDGFIVRTELTKSPRPDTVFEILAEYLATGVGEIVEIEFDSTQLRTYLLTTV